MPHLGASWADLPLNLVPKSAFNNYTVFGFVFGLVFGRLSTIPPEDCRWRVPKASPARAGSSKMYSEDETMDLTRPSPEGQRI